MKTPTTNKPQPRFATLRLHTPVLPRLTKRIRRLLNAAYCARGGAEHMSLDEWRDLEQELNRSAYERPR